MTRTQHSARHAIRQIIGSTLARYLDHIARSATQQYGYIHVKDRMDIIFKKRGISKHFDILHSTQFILYSASLSRIYPECIGGISSGFGKIYYIHFPAIRFVRLIFCFISRKQGGRKLQSIF